jgi:tetratricopeptide (TPR) repeat protein
MNRVGSKRTFCLLLVIILGLLGTRCAASKEELHAHGDVTTVKTYPKDYVHPITDINLDKVINQNRGLKVLVENATTVHDYYRGAVQEKAEGEKFFKEGKWKEAQIPFEKSIRFLQVVLRYLTGDEAYRNIYGDHVVIFLPNLLMADNYLRLMAVYKKLSKNDEALEAERYGKEYLSRSLSSVKTEWAFQVQKGFEEIGPKK